MSEESPKDFNSLRKLFESQNDAPAPKRNFTKTRPIGRASWEPKSTAVRPTQPVLNTTQRSTANQPTANRWQLKKDVTSDGTDGRANSNTAQTKAAAHVTSEDVAKTPTAARVTSHDVTKATKEAHVTSDDVAQTITKAHVNSDDVTQSTTKAHVNSDDVTQNSTEARVSSEDCTPRTKGAVFEQNSSTETCTRPTSKNDSFMKKLNSNLKDIIRQQKHPTGLRKRESDTAPNEILSRPKDYEVRQRARTFKDHIPIERFELVVEPPNLSKTTSHMSDKSPTAKTELSPKSPVSTWFVKSPTIKAVSSPKSTKSPSSTWFVEQCWNEDKWDSEESGSGLSIASGYGTDDSDDVLEKLDFNTQFPSKGTRSWSLPGHLNRSASESLSSQATTEPVHVPSRSHTLPNKGSNAEWLEDAECRSLESDDEELDLSSLTLRERVKLLKERLWCKMPEVMQNEFCQDLSPREKALQEALFELLTSELVYVHRLDVLTDVYYHSKEFSSFETALAVITKEEKEDLLLNILDIRLVANDLADDLEKLWKMDPKLNCEMADVLLEYFESRFSCYVTYLLQQSKQTALLKTLRRRPLFQRAESRLNAKPECMKLDLSAFLLEPFQRLTRYPILLEGIKKKLDKDSAGYQTVQAAQDAVSQLVTKCNEAVREQEAIELVKRISESLDYDGIEAYYFMNPHRRLVKEADVTQIDGSTSHSLHLFLFNDILFITRPTSEGRYSVLEYMPRSMVEVTVFDDDPPTWLKDNSADMQTACTIVSFKKSGKQALRFHILFKHRSERCIWEDYLTPERESEDGDMIYQDWYERKVEMTYDYCVQEEPCIIFKEGDTIVLRRGTADGEFFYGERVGDEACGWFPMDHCELVNDEVNQAHKLRVLYRRMASFKVID